MTNFTCFSRQLPTQNSKMGTLARYNRAALAPALFAMKPDDFDFAPCREPELEALAKKLTQAKGKDPLLKTLKVIRAYNNV